MKANQLIRDSVFQLNLLLWMAKEQPPKGYVVKPLFFESNFGVIYIENRFAFPQETIAAIQKSQQDISTAPEPELMLGRMTYTTFLQRKVLCQGVVQYTGATSLK